MIGTDGFNLLILVSHYLQCNLVELMSILTSYRWSINLALKVATKVFKINCLVDSEDLSQVCSVCICVYTQLAYSLRY